MQRCHASILQLIAKHRSALQSHLTKCPNAVQRNTRALDMRTQELIEQIGVKGVQVSLPALTTADTARTTHNFEKLQLLPVRR
jgi:hypothetical protein